MNLLQQHMLNQTQIIIVIQTLVSWTSSSYKILSNPSLTPSPSLPPSIVFALFSPSLPHYLPFRLCSLPSLNPSLSPILLVPFPFPLSLHPTCAPLPFSHYLLPFRLTALPSLLPFLLSFCLCSLPSLNFSLPSILLVLFPSFLPPSIPLATTSPFLPRD